MLRPNGSGAARDRPPRRGGDAPALPEAAGSRPGHDADSGGGLWPADPPARHATVEIGGAADTPGSAGAGSGGDSGGVRGHPDSPGCLPPPGKRGDPARTQSPWGPFSTITGWLTKAAPRRSFESKPTGPSARRCKGRPREAFSTGGSTCFELFKRKHLQKFWRYCPPCRRAAVKACVFNPTEGGGHACQ